MAKATHTVSHRKQYLVVGGKLQHVKAGTEITLTAAQAKSLEAKGRVRKIGQKDSVYLTKQPAAKTDGGYA